MTLEGIEGSGKSTLMRGLGDRLRSAALDVLLTREPGGTPAGERLRAVLLEGTDRLEAMAELFVVCADRAQHVATVIAPALAQGRVVLCDRFTDATRAYQGGGRGIEDAVVRTFCDHAAARVVPLLTLLVDVPAGVSRRRVDRRSESVGLPPDRLEREDDGFHARVRERYLELACEEPERIKVLSGVRAEGAVLEEAWAHVSAALGLR